MAKSCTALKARANDSRWQLFPPSSLGNGMESAAVDQCWARVQGPGLSGSA